MPLHRHEARALRVLIGALTTFLAVLLLSIAGIRGLAWSGLIEVAELAMLGTFAALVATASPTSGWDRAARLLMVMSVTFGVSSMIAEALADLIALSRSGSGGVAFAELVATRRAVSVVLGAISIVGVGLATMSLARPLGRTRWGIYTTLAGLICGATIVSDLLVFGRGIPHHISLGLRSALLLLALIASWSRYSMLEINSPIGITDDRGAGDDKPEAWHRAALGLRIIRGAAAARVLLVALVILLGLVVNRSGEGWGLFKVYALGLAMLGIAATELVGLSRLAAVPTRSGARGPAFAGLAVGLIGLALSACAFGADLLRLDARPFASSGFDLDLGPRLTMLVTITSIFLATRAIAMGVGATTAARSSSLGALFYGLAIMSLAVADGLDRSGASGAQSMIVRLLAFGFFVAALGRLLANLKTATDHLEDQRRHALGSEFS